MNAYQLAQLLSRLFPEISSFLENPEFIDDSSPGKFYTEAIKLHQKYTVTGMEKDGRESVEAYYKVGNILYLLLLLFYRRLIKSGNSFV